MPNLNTPSLGHIHQTPVLHETITRLTKTLTIRNNILERKTKTITVRNNILERKTKTLTIRNNILERKTKTLTLRNNILEEEPVTPPLPSGGTAVGITYPTPKVKDVVRRRIRVQIYGTITAKQLTIHIEGRIRVINRLSSKNKILKWPPPLLSLLRHSPSFFGNKKQRRQIYTTTLTGTISAKALSTEISGTITADRLMSREEIKKAKQKLLSLYMVYSQL